jgi:L-threonylcarbamoyladenylate synthase
VESTVLDLSGGVPEVLRPGAVTLDMLRSLLPDVRLRGGAATEGPQRSPGLLSKHYSPRAPLTLYEGAIDRVRARMFSDIAAAEAAGRRVGVVAVDEDPAVMAARLYADLREFDSSGVDEIVAWLPRATDGLSDAVADRLRRAAAGRIVRCG